MYKIVMPRRPLRPEPPPPQPCRLVNLSGVPAFFPRDLRSPLPVERPFRLPCPHSWGHSSSGFPIPPRTRPRHGTLRMSPHLRASASNGLLPWFEPPACMAILGCFLLFYRLANCRSPSVGLESSFLWVCIQLSPVIPD